MSGANTHGGNLSAVRLSIALRNGTKMKEKRKVLLESFDGRSGAGAIPAEKPKKVRKQKAIYADQVKNKPPQVVEKIVEGKLKKFYSDYCLLMQPFVKDDSKSVEQVLAEAAKQAGGKATIKRFVRFEVG